MFGGKTQEGLRDGDENKRVHFFFFNFHIKPCFLGEAVPFTEQAVCYCPRGHS